jgi:hypothetical protein
MTPDRPDEKTTRNRAGRELSSDRSSEAAPDGDDASNTATDDASSEPADSEKATEPTDEEPAGGQEATDAEFGPVEEAGPRDIVVPTRLFKLVTVATTLLAVPTVVLGFMFLDAATLQTSVARATVLFVVNWLGMPIDESVVSIALGFVGIGLIALGAGIYIVGSRFRAAGMGNAEEDSDQESTNG